MSNGSPNTHQSQKGIVGLAGTSMTYGGPDPKIQEPKNSPGAISIQRHSHTDEIDKKGFECFNQDSFLESDIWEMLTSRQLVVRPLSIRLGQAQPQRTTYRSGYALVGCIASWAAGKAGDISNADPWLCRLVLGRVGLRPSLIFDSQTSDLCYFFHMCCLHCICT